MHSNRDNDAGRSSTNLSKNSNHQSKEVDEEPPAASWCALFYFTTRRTVPLLVFNITVSLIAGVVSPATSRVTGELFNGFTSYAAGSVSITEFFDLEKTYIYYLVAIAGFSWLVESLDFALWLLFGELQAKSAREKLFDGFLERNMEWYDTRKNGISAMLPRLQSQIRELQLGTAQPMGILVTAVSTATLSLVQAFFFSWKLTLVTLASAPPIMMLVIWVGRRSQIQISNQAYALTEAQKFATNAFTAIETVKCFNGQHVEQTKYCDAVGRAARWYYRIAHANSLEMALIVLLSIAMFVQGFYYGSVLIRLGELSVGDVITTFLSAINAFMSLSSLLPQMMVLERGRAAGAALNDVLHCVDAPPQRQMTLKRIVPEISRQDIVLRNVSFTYPTRTDRPALETVSMYLASGETTFVIGRSGSGKSTIGQLLMRFYAPTTGEIEIGGASIEALDLQWLRSNVTLVEQNSALFNDTILRNITFGAKHCHDVTKEEAMKAAEFALLGLMINDMPDGLETIVGRGGSAMSGGQRQRMALARARLRDTPILILDESTSALDTISRTLIMDAIRQWRWGKTTIIITHDISQIRHEDYMFILQDGSVIQEGYRKHMERQIGSPFQRFVREDEQHIDSHIGGQMENEPGAQCFDPNDRNRTSKQLIDSDPNMSGAHQRSYAPSILRSGAYTSKTRITTSELRASTFIFPWTRLAELQSKPRPYSGTVYSAKGWPNSVEDGGTLYTSRYWQGESEDSVAMQTAISNSGAIAAASRARKTGHERRPVQSTYMQSTMTESKARRVTPRCPSASDSGIPQSLKHIMRTLWPALNRKQRIALIGGFWAATIHGLGSPVTSYVLAKLIGTYTSPERDAQLALVYSMAMLGLAFADAVATYLYRMLLEYVGQCWVDNIRAEAMRRLLDQPRAFFHDDANSVSQLVDSLDHDAEEMKNLLGRFCALIYIAAIIVGISVVWAMIAQWKLTLITLATGPYVFMVTKGFAVVSVKWESRSNRASDAASAIFTETFTMIKTVKIYCLENYFAGRYLDATRATLQVGYKRSCLSGLFYGISSSAGNFVIALMFYVGVWLVMKGDAGVHHVVQVFAQLMFAVANLSVILSYIPQISSSKDSASRLLRLAQLPQISHEHLGSRRTVPAGDIVFEDLHFSYPSRPRESVLQNINLRIEKGRCTAIVGASGSGKSTIANLLLKLYNTERDLHGKGANSLTVSGHNINEIYTSSLRTLISVVSQKSALFAGTIFDNITYGLSPTSPYATSSSVAAAASQAGIHDFITSLPNGYNTLIGEGGTELSGGQTQRIAIARALVRHPAILILDEATSALDAETTRNLRVTLAALVKGNLSSRMTVLIITHAREMMELAERVAVLEEGRVVEVGGFQELCRKRGGALAKLLSGGEWDAGNLNECQ